MRARSGELRVRTRTGYALRTEMMNMDGMQDIDDEQVGTACMDEQIT